LLLILLLSFLTFRPFIYSLFGCYFVNDLKTKKILKSFLIPELLIIDSSALCFANSYVSVFFTLFDTNFVIFYSFDGFHKPNIFNWILSHTLKK